MSGADVTEDEVLDDFISEPDQGRATLDRYLKLYPQFGPALLDLVHEIDLQAQSDRSGESDQTWIERSWRQHAARAAQAAPADLFAGVTGSRFAEVRAVLGVKTTTLIGFRDRLVLLSTVPGRVLGLLASALGVARSELEAFLLLPPRSATAQSYRADQGPETPGTKITFEELLETAKESEETRARLLEAG